MAESITTPKVYFDGWMKLNMNSGSIEFVTVYAI